MKKYVFIFALLSTSAFAQEIDPLVSATLPIDSTTSKISFVEIVKVDSLNKDQIYNLSRQWFSQTFKSAESVLDLEDKDNGQLIGKGFSDIDLGKVVVKMWYTIQLFSKEGRYRLCITNITYETYAINAGTTYFPSTKYTSEELITDKNLYKSNGSPRSVNANYKRATLKEVEQLKTSVKSFIKKTPNKKNDW